MANSKRKEAFFDLEAEEDSVFETGSLDREEIKRKVSQRLLEAIQQRNALRQNGSAEKPVRRRGRKPKEVSDINPESREEDSYALENEFERIEYDTGIKVVGNSDAEQFDFEFTSSEEELNFDH